MKKPPKDEERRCIDLRCRSKRGEHLKEEDSVFCRQMFEKYPEWYSATEMEIFEATKPFGA